jgi:hypothetical protein
MTTTQIPTASTQQATPALAPERTLSTIALIAGIVSVAFGQTFFVPLAAVILGVLGLQREPEGRSFAIWGIVLGAVMLVGWLLLLTIGAIGALIALPFLPFAFV